MEATMSSTEDTNKLQAKEAYWDIGLTEVEGFWYSSRIISSIEAFRAKFKPKREDEVVILASNPKTGTTWLKALYLPDSIKNDCKLVYITRDPKDTLVSHWHFFNKIFEHNQDPLKLERAAKIFCSGQIPFGPYWDHVLEYWEATQRSPEKVMFIKYEDLCHDPKPHVRKLASFLGKPFGDNDDDAEVENVIWRSSFDRLKDLDVNKTGKSYPVMAPLLTNDLFFRRGEVGDWRNHLTPKVAKLIDDITCDKFQSCGLYLHEE
ncbi:Cytosolic sulfotransferase 3 [Linum perenne]